MSKYLRKSPQNNKKIFKIVLLIFLTILLILLSVVAFAWSKLDKIQFDDGSNSALYATDPIDGFENQEPEDEGGDIVNIEGLTQVETAPPIPESEVFHDEDVFNILVIGTDERTKAFSTNARSDCMILVSIDKANNTVKLVSLERGIAAPILAGQYEGKYDWLTNIFRYGGADLLIQTVEHCFKVNVDHYVRFNFESVKAVVDAIGGIDMDMTKAEVDYMNEWDRTKWQISSKGNKTRLKVGENHLDGGQALFFARLRAIDSDWQRVERQRKVIIATADALKGAGLLDLNNLANEVLPLIQTNLTKTEIAELIMYAPNMLQASFDQMTIPLDGTYGGMTVMDNKGSFAIDFEVNNAALHEFLYGVEAKSEDSVG